MRASDIVCTGCRFGYDESQGCEFCLPAKERIEWPQDGEDVTLDELSKKAIVLLAENQTRLKRSMERSGAGKHGQFFEDDAKAAAMLSRAVAQMTDARRKLDEYNAKMVEQLTIAEHAELLLDWVEGLTPVQRDKMYIQLDARRAKQLALPAEYE